MRSPSGLQSAVAANSRGSVSVRDRVTGPVQPHYDQGDRVDVGVVGPADLVHLLEDDLATVG